MGGLNSEGGNEAKVFFDRTRGLVYKIVEPQRDKKTGELNGLLGFGYIPGDLHGAKTRPERTPNLLDWLERFAVNNAQGRLVLGEIVGILPDGSLVTMAPYVPDLRPSKSLSRTDTELRWRRLALAREGYSTALGWADGRPAIFVDLHNENLMEDGQGNPYVIDASSRWLTQEETDKLTDNRRHALQRLPNAPDADAKAPATTPATTQPQTQDPT